MEITGIILAGGKSSRMGTDKALVDLHGIKMIEHVIKAVKAITPHIIISANKSDYNSFGYPVIADEIAGCGPIGGIYTALLHSKTKKNLIVSCDIPYITPGLLSYLAKHGEGCDAAVPVHDAEVEPLCAVYDKSCAGTLKEMISEGNYKMQDALQMLNVKFIPVITGLPGFDSDLFININTPLELETERNKHES